MQIVRNRCKKQLMQNMNDLHWLRITLKYTNSNCLTYYKNSIENRNTARFFKYPRDNLKKIETFYQ